MADELSAQGPELYNFTDFLFYGKRRKNKDKFMRQY